MRFIVMHKVDPQMEAGAPPSPEIIQGMGKLVGESIKAGIFLDGAGLHRSAQRVRLRCVKGECTVVRGPLQGENELLVAFAMIRAASMDDAIGHARAFADVLGDAEIEIGPVVEAWDLGVMPPPERIESSRFLLLQKGDAKSEAGRASTDTQAALATLTSELRASGTLLTRETLAPSASGARLAVAGKGKRVWVDGPFTESKELIAGFSILNVQSKADAIAWANRYAEILDGNEVDVRVVNER